MKSCGTIDLIGNTPLVELAVFARATGCGARIFAKLEMRNPFGSVKDRVALALIRAAEREGRIRKGDVIIEPTSGNTGIGLAAVGAMLGYRVVLTMPDSMSVERRRLLAGYGAELALTPGAEGLKGSIAKAEELARERGGFIPGQFVNPANPQAHYDGTGPEIYRDSGGDVAAFVACVGTGGTVSGCGRYLKEHVPGVRVIAVEPDASAVLSGEPAGRHEIQGIGAGFVPDTLDRSVVDEVARVTDEDAFATAREVAARESLMLGISSGAALCAAVRPGKREEYAGRNIVVIAPDSGERYLSTGLFG